MVIYNRCSEFYFLLGKGHSLALDENIYEIRREKLKKIEALGHPAYPRKYNFSHTVPQILAEYSGQTTEELESPRVTVRVAGRIMAIRLMGKAGFAHLQQDGQRLQIYVKKDAIGDSGYELWKLLDLGDHIGVRGYLFRTRTGELSITHGYGVHPLPRMHSNRRDSGLGVSR